MDIKVSMKTIWKVIAGPFNWAYKVLPGFQEGINKWAQTILFYTALAATVLILCQLPIPRWAEASGALACAILLSFLTVVRTKIGVSEADIKKIQDEKKEIQSALEKERLHVEKLKEDIRNQRTRLLDMNWIWEVNLAQVRLERIKLFDYFVRGEERPIPWANKPEKMMERDKRAIGALKIDYTAKIGIDLKQVLVHHDPIKNVVQYWIPEPYQTGAIDPHDTWAIRAAMEFKSGDSTFDVFTDWRWLDENAKNNSMAIWEHEKTDLYKETFASQELTDQLGSAIHHEADNRLKAFFETLLGCKAVSVTKEQLESPDTLGTLLPSLMQGRTPTIETIES